METKEDFTKKYREISKKYDDQVEQINSDKATALSEQAKDYANKLNPFGRWCIITDGHTTISIRQMNTVRRLYGEPPTIKYSGPRLTKSLEPRKDGSESFIFFENAIEIKP